MYSHEMYNSELHTFLLRASDGIITVLFEDRINQMFPPCMATVRAVYIKQPIIPSYSHK